MSFNEQMSILTQSGIIKNPIRKQHIDFVILL